MSISGSLEKIVNNIFLNDPTLLFYFDYSIGVDERLLIIFTEQKRRKDVYCGGRGIKIIICDLP